MQFVVRSLGRVGCDLPRLCRWRRWPALLRREAPLMPLTPAHPDLDRLSGSAFIPWRHIPFACGSTKCMDMGNLMTAVTKDLVDHNPTVDTAVTKDLVDHNPTVDDLNVAVIQDCSRLDNGAICNNKFLTEDYSHSDLDDCHEMDDINVVHIPDGTSHRDGAIYNNKYLLEEYLDGDINDRNETPLEPMFTKHPGATRFMFQFFSVVLSRSPISNGPIQLYGYIAARDERDGMLNYIVNYSRDNPIVVQQGSLIEMTGPKRGIVMGSDVLIEFDMRIKMGEHVDDDPELIDGAFICSDQSYVPWIPIEQRIIGSSGAVDVKLAVIGYAVEATIEVVISEVQSGLSLSISSFVAVGGIPEEIQLFNGLVSQPVALRRFVVAVEFRSLLLLKFMFGNDVELHTTTNTRQIKLESKLHGRASRQIKLKAATISVKVNWSSV